MDLFASIFSSFEAEYADVIPAWMAKKYDDFLKN